MEARMKHHRTTERMIAAGFFGWGEWSQGSVKSNVDRLYDYCAEQAVEHGISPERTRRRLWQECMRTDVE
jgi:hypothetical protein